MSSRLESICARLAGQQAGTSADERAALDAPPHKRRKASVPRKIRPSEGPLDLTRRVCCDEPAQPSTRPADEDRQDSSQASGRPTTALSMHLLERLHTLLALRSGWSAGLGSEASGPSTGGGCEGRGPRAAEAPSEEGASSSVFRPASTEQDEEGMRRLFRRVAATECCSVSSCAERSRGKEHVHCSECSDAGAFVRKEEAVRHYKWHVKRTHSLELGFLRVSAFESCSHAACALQRRQTHYHCVHAQCDKVYVSTSDVQMHANLHRKESAIQQQGFRRFRASQSCASASCPFVRERTTHFHCLRAGCAFSFKLKSDMDKHKSYHAKDETLLRDGFKKYMKYEACPFVRCAFSHKANHIHCVRPDCQYVLHSTNQLVSHKRRHQRRDDALRQPDAALPASVQADSTAEESQHGCAIPHVSDGPLPDGVQLSSPGFALFPHDVACPDAHCPHRATAHLHCVQSRCYFVSETLAQCALHRSFHKNVTLLKEFAFFEHNVQCRRTRKCPLQERTRHFHCLRCEYGFVRAGTMQQHLQRAHGQQTAGKDDGDTAPCRRPFCKMKKKGHFHCDHCVQAFTDKRKLVAHLVKVGRGGDK